MSDFTNKQGAAEQSLSKFVSLLLVDECKGRLEILCALMLNHQPCNDIRLFGVENCIFYKDTVLNLSGE